VHEYGEEQNDRMPEDIAYLGLHYLYCTVCYLDDYMKEDEMAMEGQNGRDPL